MASPSTEARSEFAGIILRALASLRHGAKVTEEQALQSITAPKKDLGDLSSSIAFAMSKAVGESPHRIAEEVIKQIELDGSVASSRYIKNIDGVNGYLNAFLNESAYSRLVISSTMSGKGVVASAMGNGRRVLVESPSVNPNKPWHIGHLRNALLGDAISNILEACSFSVEREDYIDDLGLQVAESLWGFMNLGNTPDKKFDKWLGEQYVLVNRKLEEDKGVELEIKSLIQKMEDISSKEYGLSRDLSEKCVIAQYQTSAEYRIAHDVLVWESDIVREKLLEKAFEMAEKKGIAEKQKEGKYAGCVTLDLDKIKGIAKDFGDPMEDTKVLIRSNGTATYVAKDFAFHMWKFGLLKDSFKYKVFIEEQPDGKPLYSTAAQGGKGSYGNVEMVVNVIDQKQRYPQLILKAMFELMGEKGIADNITHLAYGVVSVENGSLSGRKGGWLGAGEKSYTADSLLAEVAEKTREIVASSKKVEDKGRIDEISKAVALGAIKFEFLRIAPEKAVVFSWEKALSFEGNSGPYCMYMYARANRILEKGKLKEPEEADYGYMGRDADFDLVKLLGSAQEIAEKACREHRPNVITDYIVDLSTAFSVFYERLPVLKGGDATAVRLALVYSTKHVMGSMLKLLGINPVEAM